ncbi:MAG: hypothetical protein ACOYWZ_16795 [Bacillota bacterium]
MNEYLTPEMINATVTLVIIPMLAVVTKFTVVFIKSKISELEQRISNETLTKYIRIAEDAIETAVISVNQTFVDTMKKQGTFDQAAMEKSFDMAKNKALAIMGVSAKKALMNAYNDMDVWLDGKLEYYVNQNKKQ